MADIILNFSNLQNRPALESVHFSHRLLDAPRFSYRGKGLSSRLCRFSFQWSPAVRAISMLFLLTKADEFTHGTWPTLPLAALSGGSGTSAASLDYALSKRPLWILDMFGVTSDGSSLASSLFSRWNPERKRGGNVVVAVNPQQMQAKNIEVTLNGKYLDPAGCAALSLEIEPGRDSRLLTEKLSRA